MTPRRRRAVLVGGMVAGLAVAATLAFLAIGENMLWFFTPSQLAAEGPPPGNRIRLGGIVVEGSVRREAGELEVRFDLTCLLYTSPSPRDGLLSRMPSSA